MYASQAHVLSDEQEYLQAYEDVLEKYKGRISADWMLFRLLGRWRNSLFAAWQFNNCQPAPPGSGDWLVLVSLSLQRKSGNIS